MISKYQTGFLDQATAKRSFVSNKYQYCWLTGGLQIHPNYPRSIIWLDGLVSKKLMGHISFKIFLKKTQISTEKEYLFTQKICFVLSVSKFFYLQKQLLWGVFCTRAFFCFTMREGLDFYLCYCQRAVVSTSTQARNGIFKSKKGHDAER